MMPASILAEAIRNQEEIHIARERVAVRDHVARNYRAIALPAVAAAKVVRTNRSDQHLTVSAAKSAPENAVG
jgi:hypothetical protein